MHRFFSYVPILLFLVLAGVLAWRVAVLPAGEPPGQMPSALVGKSVPQFSLPVLSNPMKTVTEKDLRGQITFVNFFASWCVPCRAEHSSLMLLSKLGIRMVGIAYKDKPADSKKMLAELGNPFDAVVADRTGDTAIDFGVAGVPESFLLDANGIILFKQSGAMTPQIIKLDILPFLPKDAS